MTSAKNLLFVDDEDSIRLTLTAILKKHGFEVTAVASVSDALAQIDLTKYDVLVSDLNIDSHLRRELVCLFYCLPAVPRFGYNSPIGIIFKACAGASAAAWPKGRGCGGSHRCAAAGLTGETVLTVSSVVP